MKPKMNLTSELGTTLRKLTMLLVLATACVFLLGTPAYAEGEGEEHSGVEEKIKKKMQEIIKLMEENERILLKVSSGASGKARRVDVDVPDPKGKGGNASKGGSSGGGSEGGASGGSSGGSSKGGAKGSEIGRKMRELIEGQKSKGGKIPGEMGELMRMIPRKSGKGGQQQGEPQNEGDQKSKEQKEQEARDARKELGEKNEQNDPKKGEKPKDPAKRVPKDGRPDDPNADQAKRKDNVPAWMATLPPELRDALAGGRAEDVPAKYRHLIKKYHLWLQKNRKR